MVRVVETGYDFFSFFFTFLFHFFHFYFQIEMTVTGYLIEHIESTRKDYG